MRDNQRSKVYAAQSAHRQKEGVGQRFKTVAEMQAYTDKLVGSAWFKRRWSMIRKITVLDGRGRTSACADFHWKYGNVIKMPTWCRHEATLLHEVAHHTAGLSHGHNWRFVAHYVELTKHQMGVEYGKGLAAAFKAGRVKSRAPRKKTVARAA